MVTPVPVVPWTVFLLALAGSARGQVQLTHGELEPIVMGEYGRVALSLRYDESVRKDPDGPQTKELPEVRVAFELEHENVWAIEVLNASLWFTVSDILNGEDKDMVYFGNIIGVNTVKVFGEYSDKEGIISGEKFLLGNLDLAVVSPNRILNKIFTIILTVMIIINTISMGSTLDLQLIMAVLKKPIGPLVGFTSQFIIMPLTAFGIGLLLLENPLFRLGLFLLGCCPGGSASNFWCLLLGGDLNLSITMTFISTISALGMMPLWIFLLGKNIVQDVIVIPFSQLFITLLMLITPICLGMLIRSKFGRGAAMLQRVIVPFTVVVLVFIFTMGIYTYHDLFLLMDANVVLAGFLVAISGYLFGALFAWLFRLKKPQIIAVSIETAFQNGSIAFIILQLSLPSPFNDIATVGPIAQLIFTGMPMWIAYASLRIYRRCCRKDQPDEVPPEPRKVSSAEAEEEQRTVTSPAMADEDNLQGLLDPNRDKVSYTDEKTEQQQPGQLPLQRLES